MGAKGTTFGIFIPCPHGALGDPEGPTSGIATPFSTSEGPPESIFTYSEPKPSKAINKR